MSALTAELRRLVSLAWPVSVAQLAAMSMAVVDTVLVGHYDPTQMAAVALGGTYQMMLLMLGMGILRVLDPIVAQAFGAGDRRALGLALARGVGLAMVLAVPSTVALWFAEPVLRALRQPPEVLPVAAAYCRALSGAHPAFLVFMAVRSWLQGQGVMGPATWAVVLANLVHAPVAWAAIYGRLGLPELGAVGAGWATSLSHSVEVLILVGLTRRALAEAWPGWAEVGRARPIGELVRMGWPLGIQLATEGWAFAVAGLMVGWLGAVPLAAHGLVLNLASLSFMVPLGISTAAATRVGNRLGADEPWVTAARAAMLLGAGVMLVSAGLFATFPAALAGLYTDDAEVLAAAARLLPIAAAFQLFDGLQVVAFGVLRGAGDTRVPSLANVLGYWFGGLPLGAWLAFGAGWGVEGMWTGLAVGLALVAALLLLRLRLTARRGGYRVTMGS